MHPSAILIGAGIACIIAVACTGCIGNTPGPSSPAPTGTPVQAGHLVVNEEQNNATVQVNQSNVITVELAENPTTGYLWNLTTSSGLRVMRDTYLPSDTTGKLIGSGGTRVWDISADAGGTQQIHAVYKRPWEPATGNETTFSMTIVVV
ncbi:MAG: protease inhibitor I42 family protein [Methanoregulaceae archaeon]|nr:protease inhibitor I42 family protein [Methanoregulaceae archaeon]